jgi:hypothetical protein
MLMYKLDYIPIRMSAAASFSFPCDDRAVCAAVSQETRGAPAQRVLHRAVDDVVHDAHDQERKDQVEEQTQRVDVDLEEENGLTFQFTVQFNATDCVKGGNKQVGSKDGGSPKYRRSHQKFFKIYFITQPFIKNGGHFEAKTTKGEPPMRVSK